MGNVYYNPWEFNLGTFSADVGIGLRLNLPIGPLRLDYGYPVSTANQESQSGKFNFTVGYTRDF
jgi:outer membrane protein insertion porin family